MVNVNKEILKKIADEGFFDNNQSIGDVVNRLAQKGYTLKGKQVSLLSQLLTFLCRDGILERERNNEGFWEYKKPKKANQNESTRN